jgi:hypothetical protein
MDQYTSSRGYKELVATMKGKAFRVVGKHTPRDQNDDYLAFRGIQSITTMAKDNIQLDIIVSVCASPIYLILHFHNTIVTNFISAFAIISAYPCHLEAHRGIVNLISYKYLILSLSHQEA